MPVWGDKCVILYANGKCGKALPPKPPYPFKSRKGKCPPPPVITHAPLLNQFHIPTMLLPLPMLLWIQWITMMTQNMKTPTLTMICRHIFMFLWMFRLVCNFTVILFQDFLWVAK